MRRIVVSTFFGFLTGIICFLGGKYGLKDDISFILVIYILANRTLAGFIIGISRIKLKWYLHGTMIGLIVGIPFSIGTLIDDPSIIVFIVSLFLGALYGFIIELFTSVVFKARTLS